MCRLSGNARVFGFEKSTGMTGTDFNNISMFFYIPYVIFETPWVIAVRRFGPGRVLAVAIVCWSAITIGTGFLHTYNQVIACRILLGACEAGLFPSLTFVISGIYPSISQGKRIAVLYISIALSGAVGGLIAYGIQSMGDRHGLEAWRWLFIIEGIISLVVGALCWVSLPTTPETAWFLSKEERATMAVIRARNQRFETSDKLSWKQAATALTDPLVWIASLSLFCSSIAMFGFSTFLPTLLKGMKYVKAPWLLPTRLSNSARQVHITRGQLSEHTCVCLGLNRHRYYDVCIRSHREACCLFDTLANPRHDWVRHRRGDWEQGRGLLCHVHGRRWRVFVQHGCSDVSINLIFNGATLIPRQLGLKQCSSRLQKICSHRRGRVHWQLRRCCRIADLSDQGRASVHSGQFTVPGVRVWGTCRRSQYVLPVEVSHATKGEAVEPRGRKQRQGGRLQPGLQVSVLIGHFSTP